MTGRRRWSNALTSGLGIVSVALVAMWLIESLDTVVLDGSLQRNGIQPREPGGLDGILWAPMLHGDWGHLASNSVPLLALGGLVGLRGRRYWGWVTAAAIALGGGLTWLLGGQGNHIGASGVVFGYFGALVGAAIFERNVRALAAAFIPLFFYTSMIVGLFPQPAISWEGHLFGLLAGMLAARAMAEPRRPRFTEPETVQDWELDEPWLE